MDASDFAGARRRNASYILRVTVNSPTPGLPKRLADVPPELAEALGSRYDLRGVLGRGGMATVYIAFDPKHHREVALKVLRPDGAISIGAERFLNEIDIVARMVHPHILPLHDSGEAHGFIYYVMPYIDGGSLRQLLQHETRFGPARAVEIATPIADALTYAHRLGVLHRDIKPENVLFAQSHPIVADFGIAKAVSSATSGAQLTRTGISLGTPGYMSPEQAAGFAAIDARSDVYSLAVIVYEMSVGEIPGRWTSEESTRAGRFLDCDVRHRTYLSAAGPVVEAALVRALAIRPDQRTASPQAFIDDLRGAGRGERRTYRPDEIQAIVNRAAEIDPVPESGSMTLGGVEQIARDVGIDTRAVRSVAAQMSARPITHDSSVEAPPTNIVIGGPTRIVHERLVPGEVAEVDFPLLVEDIRNSMGELGQVSQLGRSFTWVLNKGSSGTRNVEIAVMVRNGRTRIVVQENLNNLIGAVFGGVCGGLGGGGLGPLFGIFFGGMHMPGVAAAFFVPAWLALVFSGARSAFHYAVKRRERKLSELADRLATLARDLAGPSQSLLPR